MCRRDDESSKIRTVRGRKLSMRELRSLGNVGVKEVVGIGETCTSSKRQKVMGACSD